MLTHEEAVQEDDDILVSLNNCLVSILVNIKELGSNLDDAIKISNSLDVGNHNMVMLEGLKQQHTGLSWVAEGKEFKNFMQGIRDSVDSIRSKSPLNLYLQSKWLETIKESYNANT